MVFTVWPWEGTPGCDAKRWRLVKHVNADEAVEHDRRLLARREEIAKKRHAERESR